MTITAQATGPGDDFRDDDFYRVLREAGLVDLNNRPTARTHNLVAAATNEYGGGQ